MSLFCKFGRHDPAAGEIWNNGYYFSQCMDCQKPLLRRRGGNWEEVPKGFRIVWKARKGPPIDWKPWRAEAAQPAPDAAEPADELSSTLSIAALKSRLSRPQERPSPSLTALARGSGGAPSKPAAAA